MTLSDYAGCLNLIMWDAALGWAVIAVLFCLLIAAVSRRERRTLAASISDLVGRGLSVEYGNLHLYLSRGTGKWTILDFGPDKKPYSEEEYEDVNAAVARFVEATRID